MKAAAIAIALILVPGAAHAQTIDVKDDAGLRAALRRLGPGITVRVAPGDYGGGHYVENVKGTAERPAVIEAADPERPPVFVGGKEALHLSDCDHLVLRRLTVRGQTANGINIDDAGTMDTPSRGIVLEGVRVERVGPRGNLDGLKLSGLVDFTLRDCAFEGWGGSAIDMVGCHRGLIVGCRLTGLEGFSQDTGIQNKGGTSDITIRSCTFLDAGQRAVNVGGSTGDPYFRPLDTDCEARNITVEGCRFRGSDAPIAFVGVDGAVIRRNTFVRPKTWVFRILQERAEPRFVPCRNGRFEENVIVFRRDQVRAIVNIGPNTAAETFVLARNAWFAEDAPARSKPELPAPLAAEQEAIHGTDPLVQEDLTLAKGSPLRRLGADAFVAPGADEKKGGRRGGARGR
jgi:hypothetical protein